MMVLREGGKEGRIGGACELEGGREGWRGGREGETYRRNMRRPSGP